MMSSKNAMSGAAAVDLGLGDQLKNETEEQIAERKKKMMKSQQQGIGASLGPASLSLFAGGSNATGL